MPGRPAEAPWVMLDPSTTIRWRKGNRTASMRAVAVDAQFQRKHLVPLGQVDQTGLFSPSSIYSTSAVVGCRPGPAETGVDPPPVALDRDRDPLRAMAVALGPIRIRRFSTGRGSSGCRWKTTASPVEKAE